MDNFDDMYSDGPGASAPNPDNHGLKRKAALDFDTVPSTSTSSTSTAPFATAWAADVETGEMYNTAVKGAKISPMDIKRRAVLVRTTKCDKLFVMFDVGYKAQASKDVRKGIFLRIHRYK